MRYGRTLKRTREGDLALENGELVWLDGVDAVRQELRTTLRTIAGEDSFEPDHGFDVLTTTDAPAAVIEREVRTALTDDPDLGEVVDRVVSVEVSDPDRNRRRAITLTVSLVDGPGLDITTEINA